MKSMQTIDPPTIAGNANDNQRTTMSVQRNRSLKFLFTAIFAVLCTTTCVLAQTTSAALSGIVGDATGAKIPGAKVVLVNQASKDTRTTKTNGDGAYNFAGLDPATYTMTVTYPGFETFKENDIALHPGDSTTLVAIALKIGAENIVIEVSAHDEIATNGEVSSLITAEDIQHLATEGRDVTELVKILPGFALQPGGSSNYGLSNAAPDSEVVGPGGSLGNYAANGSPSNGVGLISDGANVQDPGTGGATTQTINMDMVEEVKVSTSNFGADTAKGPVVINAVGKAGGQSYHGTMYVIGRTTQLNSNDWLLKDEGYSKPHDRYIYPGFTVGGPIRIPGTNFNHSKKLLFLIGAEDYIQRNVFLGGNAASALHLSVVPTDCMRGILTDSYTGATCPNAAKGNADFSQNELATNLFNDPNNLVADCLANKLSAGAGNYCTQPASVHDPQGATVNGGLWPVADNDPGSMVYINKLFPHKNRTAQPVLGPGGTQLEPTDGFDRSDVYLTNYDYRQARARIDFNASQSNKFYAVYNNEGGQAYNPFTLYGNLTYGFGTLRDPSLIVSGVNSQTASANFVHIFGPTLTSETFAAAAYYLNTFNPKNEALQTATALGFPYGSLSANGSKQIPQLGYSQGLPLYSGPDFSFGQSYSRKISIDFGDNVTKVYKQHTIKVGFFYERVANNQLTAGSATQGDISEFGTYSTFYHPNDPGAGGPGTNGSNPLNTITQFLWGDAQSYSQETNTPIIDLYYTAIDGYVTDSYKVMRRLTLDAGVRFDHLGPWSDPHGVGPAYWFPQTYSTPAYNAIIQRNAPPGVSWHARDSSISDSVEQGRWAFVSPRVGFAFDAYGNGRTVFTGGAGMYRSHDTWNDYVGSMGTSLGQFAQTLNNTTLYCIDAYGKGSSNKLNPSCNYGQVPTAATGYVGPVVSGQTISASVSPSIVVVDPKDNEQPLTLTYSLGVNQSIKRVGNIIINYVGNKSDHLLLNNGFGGNINTIPQGGLFGPDPNPQSAGYGVISAFPDNIGANSGTLVDDYRPFPFYNDIQLVRHGLHSNYNSLQTTWTKFTGRFHYNFNYTWSKAMGYKGVDGNGNVPDATDFRHDYGIAAFDRTNAFNASYTYIEGKAFHVDRIASGFVNNWEISGITNVQSGPNIQASYGNNFQLTSVVVGGNNNLNTDSKTYLGTPDILLQPITTCDPSAHRGKDVFINSSCLTLGPQGVNGPFTYPYLRGPHFFNSDLSAQKGFRFSGKKELQFRYSAFNFLNHPLTSLVASTATPLRLAIPGPGAAANAAFGVSAYKQGRRVSEVTVRFNF